MAFETTKKYGNPICPDCGGQMEIDDIDYRFKGCQDEYWICEKCRATAFVKVRYGKVCKTEFTEREE